MVRRYYKIFALGLALGIYSTGVVAAQQFRDLIMILDPRGTKKMG